jgi:hypothetical protein
MGSQSCIFYNLMDNQRTATNSEIGPDLVEVGAPTYGNGLHRGGAKGNGTPSYFTANPVGMFTDNTSGCAEMILIPNEASGGGFGNHPLLHLQFDANNFLALTLQCDGAGNPVSNAYFRVAGVNTFLNFTTWGANEILHFRITWDDAGLPGAKRMILYKNGIETASSNNRCNFAGNFATMQVCRATPFGPVPNNKVIQDEIKIWETAELPDGEMFVEGFGAAKPRVYMEEEVVPPPPVQVIEPLSCELTNPQVLYMGQDLFELGYVKNIFRIKEYKTFQRDKLIQNSYNLVCKNYDNTFSIDNPVSFLSGTDWRYQTLQIIDEDNEEIWTGVVEDIVSNHRDKTATIITKNSLVEVMNTKVAYTSTAYETAAQAAQNIFDNYNYTDYDAASFITSDNILIAASCLVWVNIALEDNVTLQNAIEKLAEYAGADCFSHKGIIYLKTWQAFSGGVKINLQESNLRASPIVRSMVNSMVNDYRIGYVDTEAVITDTAGGNIGSISRNKYGTHSLPEMGGGAEEQVIFQSSIAAQFLGELHIRRTHADLDNSNCRPLRSIEISLPLSHREWIDLSSYFRLTFSDEGWADKLFEVAYFERDPNVDTIKMTAWEVDE